MSEKISSNAKLAILAPLPQTHMKDGEHAKDCQKLAAGKESRCAAKRKASFRQST